MEVVLVDRVVFDNVLLDVDEVHVEVDSVAVVFVTEVTVKGSSEVLVLTVVLPSQNPEPVVSGNRVGALDGGTVSIVGSVLGEVLGLMVGTSDRANVGEPVGGKVGL